MIIVISGNENQFGYLDCQPVNLSDDTRCVGKKNRKELKEKELCFIFWYRNFKQYKESTHFSNIYNAQFEQVGTWKECPLTPVWNIPQVNRIIGKESLVIGNQRGDLGRLNQSLFFVLIILHKFPTFCSELQLCAYITKEGLQKRKCWDRLQALQAPPGVFSHNILKKLNLGQCLT